MGSGLLLVLEGPEGAGKSTQATLLHARLQAQARTHLCLREPGGTAIGEQIRRLLLNPASDLTPEAECLLFLASRAELINRVVKPALREGNIVILDRFFLSTYAYQVHGRGLSSDGVRAANALATGGVTPDLTLLLGIDSGAGMARASLRGEPDRMERSGRGFHAAVADAFNLFAGAEWQREHPECGEIIRIDGALPQAEVFAAIWSNLCARWPQRFGA
jgi:dTMP kinase